MSIVFLIANFGLDFQYKSHDGIKYVVPYGKFIFFATTLTLGIYSFSQIEKTKIKELFLNRFTILSISLIFLGNLLSNTDLWSWRLLTILTLISISAFFTGLLVAKTFGDNIEAIFLPIILPLLLPIFGSNILEIFGELSIFGFILENPKFDGYSPPRWHFMNAYPNGLGLDAAILAMLSLCLAFYLKGILKKFTYSSLFLVSLFVLYNTNTRAALLFFLGSALSLLVCQNLKSSKKIFLFLGSLFSFCILFIWLIGVTNFISYFRLDGDLYYITSSRIAGYSQMLYQIYLSPIIGLGFGSADNQFPIKPSNIFYMALFVEIGLFGFIGSLLIYFYPFYPILLHRMNILVLISTLNGIPVLMISVCTLCGFYIYEFFEFDIFRVSVTNQTFFYFLGIVANYHRQKIK